MRARARSTRKADHQGTGGLSQDLVTARRRKDEIAYLIDMIQELGVMAERLDCQTLSGILDLARREAQLERDRAS